MQNLFCMKDGGNLKQIYIVQQEDFISFFSVKIFGAKNIKQYKGEEITILNPSKVNFD